MLNEIFFDNLQSDIIWQNAKLIYTIVRAAL